MKIKKEFWLILGINIMIMLGCIFQIYPFRKIMNYGSKLKATQGYIFTSGNAGEVEKFETKVDFAEKEITIDLKKGVHFYLLVIKL